MCQRPAKSNFWTRRKEAQDKYDSAQKEINDFYSKAASSVKKKHNLVSQYNRNSFISDIEKACLLDTYEMNQYENLLKLDTLIAPEVSFPSYDASEILRKTNRLLGKKVQEKTHIIRLENPEKRTFAEHGLKLHKKGDVCAFCGSPIRNEEYDKLVSYFSADEVKSLKNEINSLHQDVLQAKEELNKIIIIGECFYPQYIDKAKTLINEINSLVSIHNCFLNKIEEKLLNKMANLFEDIQKLDLEVPEGFNVVKNIYDKLVSENNNNDLGKKKIEASEKIRFHYVKEELNNFDYDTKNGKITVFEMDLKQRIAEYEAEEQKITGPTGINNEIKAFQNEIVML